MSERIVHCDCTNEKTLVDCDLRFQRSFDLKEACRECCPELYERQVEAMQLINWFGPQ